MIKTYFLSPDKKYLPVICMLLFMLALFFWKRPKAEGDAIEYLMMQESMRSNASLVFSSDCVAPMTARMHERTSKSMLCWYEQFVRPAIENEENFAGGYVRCPDGQYRCYHFWFYSFCSLPFRIFCDLLSIDPQYSFLMLNLSMLVWLIYATYRTRFMRYEERVILSFIWIYTFAVFYFYWIHPEVFSATLLCISILYFLDGKTSSAILLASFASLQNQPIALILPVLYLSDCLKNPDNKSFPLFLFPFRKKTDWVKVIIAAFIVLLPSFYYLAVYGHSNPISALGCASFRHASFSRFISLWLDLNQGIVLGFSGAIFILIAGFIESLKSPSGFQVNNRNVYTIVMGAILISIPCLIQENWNAGSAYMLRYGLWIGCPLIIAAVLAFRRIGGKRRWIVLGVGLFLHSSSSWLSGIPAKPAHLNFNVLSRKVLEYFPHLYNPEPEIFAERLSGYEGSFTTENLFIFRKDGEIRKMMVRNSLLHNDCACVGQKYYYPAVHTKFGRVIKRGDWAYLNGLYYSTDIQEYSIRFDNESCKWNGWSYAEDEFRWSLGDHSTLSFSLPDNKMKPVGLLRLTVQAPVTGRDFQVYLNEHLIFGGVIYKKEIILLDVEPNIFDISGQNKLTFKVLNPQIPSNSKDSRMIGIGFYSLSFVLSE